MLEKIEDLVNEGGAKALVVNVQIPFSIGDMYEFVQLLLDAITDTIRSNDSISAKTREEIFSWKVKQLQFLGIKLEREKKGYYTTPTSLLRKSLIDLWNDYMKKEDIKIVLLMFDDLHYLVNAVKGAVYDLRAVFQYIPKYDCNYQLIITGYKTLFSDIRGLAEPLTRFFESIYLEPFELEDTMSAILVPLRKEKIPVSIGDDVIETIYNKTGGHPYFISFIMRDLIDMKKDGSITGEYFNTAYHKISEHMISERFDRDYGSASEKERNLLIKIAEVDNEIVKPADIKKRFNFSFWDRLCQKNLLIKVDRGKYMLYHPLFKEFLRTLK